MQGVIYRAVKEIFKYIPQHPEGMFHVRASYVEIYNENICDLLTGEANLNVLVDSEGRSCTSTEC